MTDRKPSEVHPAEVHPFRKHGILVGLWGLLFSHALNPVLGEARQASQMKVSAGNNYARAMSEYMRVKGEHDGHQ